MNRTVCLLIVILLTLPGKSQDLDMLVGTRRSIDIPTLDISQDVSRQVVIANGRNERQGHADMILMPDGKTIYIIWTIGHGGPATQLKKSVDGGKTWSDLLAVPENWKLHANCSPLYMLQDPDGRRRLTTFVNRGPSGLKMYRAWSDDDGATWMPFEPVLVAGSKNDTLVADVMPFTAVVPIHGGKQLLGVTNHRRPHVGGRSNLVTQSISSDGGITWSHWRIVLDLGEPFVPCEPELIRSPDGKQLMMLIRENNRAFNSWIMVSDNEGATWSEPRQAPASITFHRHQAEYAPDGRLVVVGRDVAAESPTKGHFVGWVGTYEDLLLGREGQYRIKLLHSYSSTEYPGLVLLKDGTFVGSNSVGYREGEMHSLVVTRFNLAELDRMLAR